MNYLVVLFKNKKRRKIINQFKTLSKAKEYFKSLKKDNEVNFPKNYENGSLCRFELGLLGRNTGFTGNFYIKDEMGRQIKAEVDEDFVVLDMVNYDLEEKIFDVFSNTKIDFNQFTEKYLSSKSLKLISKLNNKVVLQNDDIINLFSFKNDFDSARFLMVLENKIIFEKRTDVMIVGDSSKQQKKYLYDILESKGISKSILYRRFTTFPK